MYARLLLFHLTSKKPSAVQKFIDTLDGLLQKSEGFVRAVYFSDETVGEHGALIIWETQEHARRARSEIFPRLRALMGDLVKEPLWFPLLRVITPKKQSGDAGA